MKKIITTFFALFISINSVYGAEQSCLIDQTPDIITEYRENNNKILKNIKSQLKKPGKQNKKLAIKANNLVSDWGSYYAKFDYLVLHQIMNNVPYQVDRDHRLLESELEGLKLFLNANSAKGYSKTVLKNICDGVTNCNLSNEISFEDAMVKLIQNSSSVYNFFISNISGGSNKGNGLILVADDFTSQIENLYSEESITACSNTDGLGKRVSDSMAKIRNLNKGSEDGIKLWTDGWNKLIGKTTDDSELNELNKHIAGAGLAGNTDEVFEDLESANERLDKGEFLSFATNNNFLSNTLRGPLKKIEAQLDAFGETLENMTKDSENEGEFVITEIEEQKSKIDKSEEIRLRVEEMYEKQLLFSRIQNNELGKLQDRIIMIHNTLSESIDTLETTTIKLSEKVCNDQDSGNGKCEG